MPEHFVLREDELLRRFNALPGVQLERRTFGRYIRPLMVDPRRNEARQAATGRTQPWVYDPALLWQWDEYLAVRAELIRRGEWGEKRPYSIEDLEGIALLGEHGNVTERLFPAQAEPLEVAGNAQPALALASCSLSCTSGKAAIWPSIWTRNPVLPVK